MHLKLPFGNSKNGGEDDENDENKVLS